MGSLFTIAAFVPPVIVTYTVAKQSKTFAALAQMGSMQGRLATESECVSPVESDQAVKAIKVKDKLIYTLGVLNLAWTAYVLGAFPTKVYLWYAPKTVFLTALRWWEFRQTRQHYLLYDFCYWANALLIWYLFVYPHSAVLFKVCWCLANGPLAWSTLAFSHSLIFHSYPHLTSVIIHVSPMLVVHGLRFYPSKAFSVCDDFPACEVTPLQMVWDSLRYFYLWWIVLYYLWVFVLMGERVKQRGYQTLFDRVIKGPAKFLARVHPHHLVQKAAYAGVHLIFGCVTMTLAALMWQSFTAHVFFIVSIVSTVAYNAAAWYFSVFLTTYQDQLQQRALELQQKLQ